MLPPSVVGSRERVSEAAAEAWVGPGSTTLQRIARAVCATGAVDLKVGWLAVVGNQWDGCHWHSASQLALWVAWRWDAWSQQSRLLPTQAEVPLRLLPLPLPLLQELFEACEFVARVRKRVRRR